MRNLPPAPEPTEKQIALIEKWGYEAPATRREATKLISDEIEHRKQIRYYAVEDDPYGTSWDAWDPISDCGNGGDYDPGGDYD